MKSIVTILCASIIGMGLYAADNATPSPNATQCPAGVQCPAANAQCPANPACPKADAAACPKANTPDCPKQNGTCPAQTDKGKDMKCQKTSKCGMPEKGKKATKQKKAASCPSSAS